MFAGSLRFIVCVVAASLSIDGGWGGGGGGTERGRDRAEIRLSSLSFLTWRGRPLGPSFSGKWTEHTHTLPDAHNVVETVSVANQ